MSRARVVAGERNGAKTTQGENAQHVAQNNGQDNAQRTQNAHNNLTWCEPLSFGLGIIDHIGLHLDFVQHFKILQHFVDIF